MVNWFVLLIAALLCPEKLAGFDQSYSQSYGADGNQLLRNGKSVWTGTRGQNIYYKGERSYADPEGGRGVRTPSPLKITTL